MCIYIYISLSQETQVISDITLAKIQVEPVATSAISAKTCFAAFKGKEKSHSAVSATLGGSYKLGVLLVRAPLLTLLRVCIRAPHVWKLPCSWFTDKLLFP